MSRVGRKPIPVPAGVKVAIQDNAVAVEGPKGKLSHRLPEGLAATFAEGALTVESRGGSRESRALHGLHRTLLANALTGVHAGFRKELEIHGVGFRAAVQGKNLTLNLGFSHPILYSIPEGIRITVNENTKLLIEGIDKCLVGQVAAEIRRFYPPEPYKGKGVRYVGEVIRRKAGKTAQSK
ncbi:50S ribosomal protein L6 [Methylacidimicrobium cyclopophantes]|uniref:Large ribosomal subunit protein uL6 n=1 Tax=Methylacidimicrobium cyclopophantes TaxID=1041766 RepID=A0A5E6M8H3_9BACT|nr:50S ribosomal protein L6 [Methylacidimicrobium cyclopophantes]VVM05851.1 50S ribosomal protein L6 [Methylacidimicrobium cyclopophantes]